MPQYTDEEQKKYNKELGKYAALDEADINKVIATLVDLPQGRKFLWWLLKIGRYGLNPFSPDALVMAFQAGEMNVGNAVLSRLIEVSPTGFAELQLRMKEEDDRRSSAAARIAYDGDLFDASPDDSGSAD